VAVATPSVQGHDGAFLTGAQPERCKKHDLPLYSCAACEPNPYPRTVWISAAGDCFHALPACKALVEGQAYAERIGYRVHDVTRVTSDRALDLNRQPCQICILR
jgi:hypothetical protein